MKSVKGTDIILLQVAYERGFIDESIPLKNYKLKVEDEAGDIVPEYSLVHLIESCHDFVSEVSQLEHVCLSLGCRALITTKYHAEYAGEGIEYCWGYSKALYRKYPLASKKGKENFDKLLAQCISMETITKDLVRKFSARARRYMLTYKSLELMEKQGGTPAVDGDQQTQTMSLAKIENMTKIIKSHRAALDFDKEFIMKSVTASNFDYKEEVEVQKKMAGTKRKRV